MKKFFLFFVTILIALAIIALYMGAFQKIVFQEAEMGPYVLVYKEHVGAYQETGKVQDEIYHSLLNEEQIETTQGFGIYFDDPKIVAKELLRSEVGCILKEEDKEKLADLLEKGYQIKTLEKKKLIVTSFPLVNKLSIFLGVFRVYPEMQKYITEKGYQPSPSMEIYDNPNKKIIYLFEIKE